MQIKGKILLDGNKENYLLGGGRLLFLILVSSKKDLFQKRERYEKFLNGRDYLVGSLDESRDSVVFPLGEKKAHIFPYEPKLTLYIVYEIEDYFVMRNPDIRNVVGIRFEDIILSLFIGAVEKPNCHPKYWDFEVDKQRMKIGLDPFRACRKKNRCGAVLLRCRAEDWNDFVSYYDSMSLLAGFWFFLADMDFKHVKFMTVDGSPAHYYHLVPRSVWERSKQRREKIIASPDYFPVDVFAHQMSEAAKVIFEGKIYEVHYPQTHENDVIYANEFASVFSAFEAEFHWLYGCIDAKLLNKSWIDPVRKNFLLLINDESDVSAKDFYCHCLNELQRPSLADRFKYFFAQEKTLVGFILESYFLDSIPVGKLIQTMTRIRNDLMHGNPTGKPDRHLPEIFGALRCFVYVLQFRRIGYCEKDIETMLKKLFKLSIDLSDADDKGVEIHWGRQSKKPGGITIVDWKQPI